MADPSRAAPTRAEQRGNLDLARAHWVARDTIAWPAPVEAGGFYHLHFAPRGGLRVEPSGVMGGQTLTLLYDPAGLSAAVIGKFPHLAGYAAFRLSQPDLPKVPEILKGQIAVSATGADAHLNDATGVQIAGVLDDLFTYDGPLGVTYAEGVPTLRVWAPTARSVHLLLLTEANAATPHRAAMHEDPHTGVWSARGHHDWTGRYYLYEVEVFVPATGRVEHNRVTDPYSVSLATGSARSQIVDLADPALMPSGWADLLRKPPLERFADIVLYELHIRDFSINDPTVPAELRGTYLAFTDPETAGMRHLRALAAAGLTHVHLLPAFDFASVPEDPRARVEPDMRRFGAVAPDSPEPQAVIAQHRDQDGFNWGYDPYHYMAPEGSYATDPAGPARIREFRTLVQGLNGIGLRVTMDVVFNHTTSAGQNPASVLDRIVPGYYHRRNADGEIEMSTCCPNTASEHAMMEKLMVDALVLWARAYKVDSFRFDLMGHHMAHNLIKIRDVLQALTPEKDGVDGAQIYLYGEGWDFGEVAHNARGVNATQVNLAGTGIGSFSDRLRDAVRGGPMSDDQEPSFLTAFVADPDDADDTVTAPNTRLLHESDWIRLGLAGNLADYTLIDSGGTTVTGAQVDYHGQPAGYAAEPQECVNYIEAHDNETLYDALAYKLPPGTPMAHRVRIQNLGNDLVLLGQGIPFFQAGQDLLRSKSLDGNSYNSGDWFNRLDWGYQSNNWGVGLPPEGDNGAHWPLQARLLADPALKPAPSDIQAAATHFQEMLRLRQSSRLFRLGTAAEIKARVRFLNTGPRQVPGLIVMTISDQVGARLDYQADGLVLVFNATGQTQSFRAPGLAGLPLTLHPILAASADPIMRRAAFDQLVGALVVPAHTTAVFVLPEGSAGRLPDPLGAGARPAPATPDAVTLLGTVPATAFPGWGVVALGGLAVLGGLALWRRRSRPAPAEPR